MATFIPRTQGPQIQVQQGPQVRETTRVDSSGSEAIARGLGQAASVMSDFAQRAQERNDTAAIMSARRELSEWEHATFDPANPEGISRFKGLNALEANDVIMPDLQQRVSQISERLTPHQRQQFEGIALTFQDGIGSRLDGHMDREHSAAIKAESDAAVGAIMRDAATAGMNGDMARQEELLSELLGANEARFRAEGAGDTVIAEANRMAVSSVRRQTIESVATTDPFAAQELLDQYRDQLSPDDRARVESVLYPAVEDRAADDIVDRLLAGEAVHADAPESIDAAIILLESGGVDSAKNPESSAAGAGQFIESTWLDMIRRYRPELADGRSREEVLALRSDGSLSREMVSAYRRENAAYLQSGGVQATAVNLYAAHHFGPKGGVAFGRASDDTPMSDILSAGQMNANPYLRGKTKAQVVDGWRRRGLPVASSAPRSEPPQSESQALAWARENIENPSTRRLVMGKIRERFAIREAGEREANKAWSERVNTAMQYADPTQTLPQILGADDYAKAVSEGKIPALESLRLHRIQGTFVQDDLPFKEELYREAVIDPDAFMQRDFNDPEVQVRLSTASLAQFKSMQADATKPEKRDEWASESQLLSQAYQDIGIAGTGKKNAESRDELQRAFLREKRAFNERNNGRNPNASEMQTIINGLKQPMVREYWWRPNKEQPLYRAGENFNVPADERVQLIEGLRAAGISSPTEAQVVEAYRRGAGDTF